MQIEGTREFFSKISSLNKPSVQNNTSLPGNTFGNVSSPVQNLQKPATDTLFLSDIGKKLSLNVNKAPTLTKKQEGRITDPTLQLIDKSMSQVKEILERMYELTVAAQDKKLADIDRVDMQIEIEDLGAGLGVMPRNLMVQSRGGSPTARMPSDDLSTWVDAFGDKHGDERGGNNTSLLSRMRTRIANGEKWDVREAWSAGFTKVTYDDEGEEVWEVYDAAWHVVSDDDKQIFETKANVEYGADTFHITYEDVPTGEIVPTVREVLESSTPIIVMDAESAANGAALLEKHIKSVQKWHDRIVDASIAEQSKEIDPRPVAMLHEAYIYFRNMDVAGFGMLNEPSRPYLFLGADGVNNQLGPLVVNLDVTRYENTDPPDGIDYFTNKPIDDSYNGYVLDPDVLSKVLAGEGEKILEGFTIPKQPKTVYIKGL